VQRHTHEQPIVEIATQARQRLAQRGLLRMQRVGGARQAAFAKQDVEDPKCVQMRASPCFLGIVFMAARAIA